MAPDLQDLTLVEKARSTHWAVTNHAGHCKSEPSYAHWPYCRIPSKVCQWNLEMVTALIGALENEQDFAMSPMRYLRFQHMKLS